MNATHPSARFPSQGDPNRHPVPPAPGRVADERVRQLVDFYRRVQHERMQGIPLLNPALSVEAVGFLPQDEGEDGGTDRLDGVLVTPWFMSLVRLPLHAHDHAGRVGRKAVHGFGTERFEFIGAHDPALGYHEACALFSPMGDFRTQAQARETAEAVLAELRPAPLPEAPPEPARRAFFMGRRTAAGGSAR